MLWGDELASRLDEQCLGVGVSGAGVGRLEVIVVDDVSSDPESRRVQAELSASGRATVVHQTNAGVSAAHAAGMQTVMVPDLVHPSDEIRALGIAVLESLDHVRLAAFPKG